MSVASWLMTFGLVLAGYLAGAVPFGLLAGRLRGVDLRSHGSGNIGATNAGRVLGRPVGMVVFGLDLLKGLLPVAVAGAVLHRSADLGDGSATLYLLWVLVAAACVLGHMFPVYLGFKGGKGVATSLGVLLGIYPYFLIPALAMLVLWIAVTLITRYVSAGSVIASGAFPITFAVVAFARRESWPGGALWPLHAFGAIMALLVIYRHRSNIRRLVQGTEAKIGASRAA
jgi:glycerol-3-phosphate acyltransferase PlsY